MNIIQNLTILTFYLKDKENRSSVYCRGFLIITEVPMNQTISKTCLRTLRNTALPKERGKT